MLFALVFAACVPVRGGWDVEQLGSETSRSLRRRGSRLGDMTPFPAWVNGRLEAVACRWPSQSTIPIRIATDPAHEAWLEVALRAVDRQLDEVELVRAEAAGWFAGERPPGSGIGIVAADEIGTEGPLGSADTRVRCRVHGGPRGDGPGLGEVVEAEIRIRTRMVDALGRAHVLTAEEWVGALLHELAHALGFQGHAATGDSVLVLARDALRRAGRRALAEESIDLGPLTDLYALRPGRRLGIPVLTPASRAWLDRISRRLSQRAGEGGSVSGPWASVGDRAAQLEWWVEDGHRLRIVFPGWSRRLRDGQAIVAWPDRVTREWLGHAPAARAPGANGLSTQPLWVDSRVRARSMWRSPTSFSPEARRTTPSRNSATGSSGASSFARSR